MKIKVPCFFRICNAGTEMECIKKGVLGGYPYELQKLQNIEPGHIGFLYNAQQDVLIGVFQAESKPCMNNDPSIFGGKFPLQTKVKLMNSEVLKITNAQNRLAGIIKFERKKNFSVPAQSTYGPDVTERILKLFYPGENKYPDELKTSTIEEEVPISAKKSEDASFTLDDVAGLGHVKEFIKQRIIAPFNDEERAFKFKLRIGGGMLLFGPPGTGKTLIATAISSQIEAKFYEITPSFIIGYPGQAEERLEKLFADLNRQPRSVLFIDEAEWILKTRDKQSSSVMERITPVLLAQLSTLFKQRDNQIVIIAATNEPEKIDPAFLRPGRFDKIFYVGLPAEKERAEILAINLKGRENNISEAELAEISLKMNSYSGADIAQIVDEAAYKAFIRKSGSDDFITKQDILAVVNSTSPSVPADVILKHQKWADSRGISL